MKKPLDWCSGPLSLWKCFSKRTLNPNNARHDWWPKMHKFWEKMPEEALDWRKTVLLSFTFPSVDLMLRGQGLKLAWLSEASLDATAAWPRPTQGHGGRSCRPLFSPAAAAAPASHVYCCCRLFAPLGWYDFDLDFDRAGLSKATMAAAAAGLSAPLLQPLKSFCSSWLVWFQRAMMKGLDRVGSPRPLWPLLQDLRPLSAPLLLLLL